MEAKKRIENDPTIGEVLFHDDDCLIKVNYRRVSYKLIIDNNVQFSLLYHLKNPKKMPPSYRDFICLYDLVENGRANRESNGFDQQYTFLLGKYAHRRLV